MATDLPTIAKELRALDKKDIRNWLRRGELLTLAKDLAGNDANFRGWLRKNAVAKTTAYKSMAAWRDFGTVPTSGHFSIEAMATLAPSPEARAEAIAISADRRITRRIASELIAKHMPDAGVRPPTLTQSLTAPFEEILTVDGGVVIIRGRGLATPSDMLGMLMLAQRQLRELMTRTAAAA